jgi:hypothetical protein
MVLPLAALSLALAVSCGPSFRPVQVRTATEAEYLRAEATAINLQGEEIVAAEGYFAKAREMAEKDVGKSAAYADLAAAYYRIALARHSLLMSGQALNVSENALKTSQEQVETYSRVLARVNANAGEAK